jgi:glyoxylase-like metal-dependent hydrolase (beta-lactamase superfamily II)
MKPFASTADTEQKAATLEELADGIYAYTAQGDPNVGAIVGPESVVAVDARSTPAHAQEWLDDLRRVTDKPISHLVLTHYHAVRVMGAAAFGDATIVAHTGTARLIAERGQADFDSEVGRFPRLFRDVAGVPGLTRPDLVFADELTLRLGPREVVVRWLGRGHTEGDVIVAVPHAGVLFAGDLVEAGAAPYMGDSYVAEWGGATLDRLVALRADALVPGRGPAVRKAEVADAVDSTRTFLRTMHAVTLDVVRREGTLKEAFDRCHERLAPDYAGSAIFEHCMPFNVQRTWDEVAGARPRVWTTARDQEVWRALQGA